MRENYIEKNNFKLEHLVLFWLKQSIYKVVDDYLKHYGITYQLNWILRGWSNLNMKGDYHNLHNYPHSRLSCIYYINVHNQYETEIFRSDLNPVVISFFDIWLQANINSIKNDKLADPEYLVLQNSEDLLIWPSFIHQLVHPNISKAYRISLPFNVIIEWSNNLIPKKNLKCLMWKW